MKVALCGFSRTHVCGFVEWLSQSPKLSSPFPAVQKNGSANVPSNHGAVSFWGSRAGRVTRTERRREDRRSRLARGNGVSLFSLLALFCLEVTLCKTVCIDEDLLFFRASHISNAPSSRRLKTSFRWLWRRVSSRLSSADATRHGLDGDSASSSSAFSL